MELSLAGLIGALFGLVIGVIDFGIVATMLRRAWEKRIGSDEGISLETVLKLAFVVNALVFAGLGYWFGATMAG